MSRGAGAIHLGRRTTAALIVASCFAFLAFTWPFFVAPGSSVSASTVAPILFGAALLLSLTIVLAQLADGGLDAKALALLGVLSALGAALRPLGAGTAGVELVFFILVLGGRALGPGFGFTLGCTTLFASALITGGVGPWLPYQMFGCACVGLGAGLLPRATGRREIAMLVAYGAVSAFAYGLLINLSFWPFALGEGTRLSYVPGAPVLVNLHRYLLFDATTSLGWDTGRAITNAVLLLLAGAPVLAALRRSARRASFGAPVIFLPDHDDAAIMNASSSLGTSGPIGA
jgi:energy-coupling factor transport system substrate-specific component